MNKKKLIVINTGEPAGIDHDLVVLLAQQAVICADLTLLMLRTQQPDTPRPAGELIVLAIKAQVPIIACKLNAINSNNGLQFVGHTEYLAKRSHRDRTESLRIALVTTHLPLIAVPDAITFINEVITILVQNLKQQFWIAQQGAHIGREEIEVIIPAMDILRAKGYNLVGPLPADTLFQSKYLQQADAVLAMYHDQGLPVLKHQWFGRAVNITLGLPFIRIYVDHGTALELAGSGQSITSSIETALNITINMINYNNE